MDRLIVRVWMVLLLAGFMAGSLAAPPVIGVVTARGSFFLDKAVVQGNATLFEGALLETAATPSQVRLQAGPRLHLGAASRGKIYDDRLVLEKGEGQLEGAAHYRIETRDLRILPESAVAVAHVALAEPGRITVAALAGGLRVTTTSGTLVAKLARGTALEFTPQPAGASAPMSLAGCLTNLDGRFLLKDDTSNVTFELRGQDLAVHLAQHVSITATVLNDAQPGKDGAPVIQVTQIKRLAGACPVSAAGRSAAKKSAMSGTTKAIIAGVAIAAAAGGAAIGLTGEENQPISR